MLSEVFWSFLVTTSVAGLISIIAMLYKSKCQHFECCGLKIDRDVAGEERIDELATHPPPQLPV